MVNALIPNFRVWRITNTDSGEKVEGDFEPEGATRNVSAAYARMTSLNRQDTITQFLHGNPDTFSFQGQFMSANFLQKATDKLDTLIAWTKRDVKLRRPPIVQFSIGASDPVYGEYLYTIDSIGPIVYDNPKIDGSTRGMTFTVNLVEFKEFTLEGISPGDSRYHHFKEGEYFELVAAREYNEPLLGDRVRKRHPELQAPAPGDVAKFPNLESIQDEPIEPNSIALKGLNDRRDNDRKQLRECVLDRLNVKVTSHIIPEGL